MKIAIVGSGALGLYYGALLQRGGADVHFLLRSDYDAITGDGLRVYSPDGNFHLPHVQGYRSPAEIGPVDLVLVGLKTGSNDAFSPLITPLLHDQTQILTLQNGLGNEEALAKLFGAERILGGVAFLCSNRGEAGTVHHLGAGRIVMGEHVRITSERVERIAALFRHCTVDCRSTDDLTKSRWEKLVWNIPFNGLSALLLQPVDRLLAVPATRALLAEIMAEVIAGANAQQLRLPIAAEYAQTMLTFTDTMGAYKPSMQIDREAGREMELTAILRKPLEFGQREGVAMTRVEMLTTLLEQVEKK